MGYWSIELPFYGPAKVVAAQWEYAKQKFSAIDGVTFREGKLHRFPVDPKELPNFQNSVAVGIPSLSVFGVGGGAQRRARLVFAHRPDDGRSCARGAQGVSRTPTTNSGMSMGPMFFLGPASNYPRCFLMLFGFPIEHDVEKNKKNRENFKRVIRVAAEHGWGEYRTHTAFMETVMDTYSFNNHALRRFHETIKDALDPERDSVAGEMRHLAKTHEKGNRMKNARVGLLVALESDVGGPGIRRAGSGADRARTQGVRQVVLSVSRHRRREARHRFAGGAGAEAGCAGRAHGPDRSGHQDFRPSRRPVHADVPEDGSKRRGSGCHRGVFDEEQQALGSRSRVRGEAARSDDHSDGHRE